MPPALPPDRDLLHIQLRTLFRLDHLGRLASPGPRIFIGSAGAHRIVRARADIPETTVRAWLRCADDTELRARVESHAPVSAEYRGPAFVLPNQQPSSVATTIGGSTILHPELVGRGWKLDEQAPYVGVVREGHVVAVCYSSRWSDLAAEAGVETVAAYRGRGLAREVVRAWAAAVQATGRYALYSTTWENEASRRVAERLGGHRYGEDWHLS